MYVFMRLAVIDYKYYINFKISWFDDGQLANLESTGGTQHVLLHCTYIHVESFPNPIPPNSSTQTSVVKKVQNVHCACMFSICIEMCAKFLLLEIFHKHTESLCMHTYTTVFFCSVRSLFPSLP